MQLYGQDITSRLLLGTAQYPSPSILNAAIKNSASEIITVSLRRETADGTGAGFWDQLRTSECRILPNTAGCHSVQEALTTAHMARELFDTPWIKLEVIGHSDTLQPDVFALVEAARVLSDDGFQVFPYTTDDLVVGEKLLEAGCEVLMPWGAPIGSGQGLRNPDALRAMRAHFPDVPLIVDAGIGCPSDATQAMELGMDAVLLNTAVAKAGDPAGMARAIALAIEAGREGYLADPMERRDMAVPSTPVLGLAALS
ncbi:thiazole synthase [Phaeobacter gallaeciensis]|uniref:Thiazole synthase n=1 Tax=Phaeobacter gallaeciensis TaxID=60890 RepID=A0AAD0EC25_9RHOB|nr:thiazole synthase [Phaeobacter gallaeciensis]AHD10324.1 thiazole-phosphate synthase [Phaeobacter gallaeciensis DSM 26640]ATE93588.1 thiazole biosynthesis protein ThiG [Phaeobacter gallaeciensis]ATE96591.1 thiazole biosynthesis protein ThiG [Phaeobacter gallaeciensis]ATF02252.1 thiazole biosynthesis protein ThiG [Phaeobacter gallaeciensis]ATF06632.1 thiazole biosynthesis protein ThiG [Phaeobacter gallaeciensis]